MNYIDEWQTLVQDLRLHIAQEYPDLALTAKSAAKTAAIAPQVAPATPAPATAVTLPKVPELPKKPTPVAAPLPPTPPTKPKTKAPEISNTPLEPTMQALPRPFVKPAQISLIDCLEKFEKQGIATIDAPKEVKTEDFSQLVMVSFFSPGTEEQKFVQKIAASVSERIIPCGIYLQPGLTAAAECFTLAAANEAKALILAYSQDEMPKLATWFAYFGEDLHASETQQQCLISKRQLFNTPVYELLITSTTMNDSTVKRALWTDIQKIAQGLG